jgi:DNA-binding NarL/FixJ family response regulator
LEKVQRLKPDLLILDIGLPGMNGIDVTRKLSADLPELPIIVLSMHAENSYIVGSLQAGARAYLIKETAFEELYIAIQQVRQGRRYLSREVTSTVLDDLLAQVPAASLHILTEREREILRLIAEGTLSKEIGARLNISERTVEAHRARIMDKLDLHSIAALTRYAIKEGISSLED